MCGRSLWSWDAHRDLLKHAGLSYGGQFKNIQNHINETKPDGTVVTRFTPLAPYETEPAIGAICESYRQTLAMEGHRPSDSDSDFYLRLFVHPSI